MSYGSVLVFTDSKVSHLSNGDHDVGMPGKEALNKLLLDRRIALSFFAETNLVRNAIRSGAEVLSLEWTPTVWKQRGKRDPIAADFAIMEVLAHDHIVVQ